VDNFASACKYLC